MSGSIVFDVRTTVDIYAWAKTCAVGVMYIVLVGIVVGEVQIWPRLARLLEMQYFKDATLIKLSVSGRFHDSIHPRWSKESVRELEVSLEGVGMATLFRFEGDGLKT
jgi:hypothetical protein